MNFLCMQELNLFKLFLGPLNKQEMAVVN
jgi:hypothetical protein